MGYVLGGIAAGVLIGYPLGGFMFEFFGESAPFVVVSFAAGALVGKTTGVKLYNEALPSGSSTSVFTNLVILL